MLVRRALISTFTLLLLAPPAKAWFDKGHMVVARLCWQKLSPDIRAAVSKILLTHPHYQEFLAADQPSELSTEEWVFWRAATWPDWTRDHHATEYYKPDWHFINLAYVPPGSHLDPADYPASTPNVVTQIAASIDKVSHGTAEEKAVYLCWVLHLVGDIHQPLHCAELYSEQFPHGDRGGNLDLIRVGDGKPVVLHLLWDGLPGESISYSSVTATAAESQTLAAQNRDRIDQDLMAHQTPDSWAQEGLANAAKYAYLDGQLKLADSENHPADADVPQAPADYVKHSQQFARICLAKAGDRLVKVVNQCVQ